MLVGENVSSCGAMQLTKMHHLVVQESEIYIHLTQEAGAWGVFATFRRPWDLPKGTMDVPVNTTVIDQVPGKAVGDSLTALELGPEEDELNSRGAVGE